MVSIHHMLKHNEKILYERVTEYVREEILNQTKKDCDKLIIELNDKFHKSSEIKKNSSWKESWRYRRLSPEEWAPRDRAFGEWPAECDLGVVRSFHALGDAHAPQAHRPVRGLLGPLHHGQHDEAGRAGGVSEPNSLRWTDRCPRGGLEACNP